MKTILPAKEWIILTTTKQETKSGLDVPTAQKDAPQIGTIYKIGKGTPPVPMKVGDIVVFKKYMGNKMFISEVGEELDFLPFEDIMAVIPKGKTEDK